LRFNRGPRGAARILKRAPEIPDDGIIAAPARKAAAARESNTPRAAVFQADLFLFFVRIFVLLAMGFDFNWDDVGLIALMS
jgi:hypothetical protein